MSGSPYGVRTRAATLRERHSSSRTFLRMRSCPPLPGAFGVGRPSGARACGYVQPRISSNISSTTSAVADPSTTRGEHPEARRGTDLERVGCVAKRRATDQRTGRPSIPVRRHGTTVDPVRHRVVSERDLGGARTAARVSRNGTYRMPGRPAFAHSRTRPFGYPPRSSGSARNRRFEDVLSGRPLSVRRQGIGLRVAVTVRRRVRHPIATRTTAGAAFVGRGATPWRPPGRGRRVRGDAARDQCRPPPPGGAASVSAATRLTAVLRR